MTEQRPGIRPRPSLGRRLDEWSRRSFPAAATLALILCLEAPLGIPVSAQLQTALPLASLYFWSVHRPTSMPPWLVFGLGLLVDLLQIQPMGLSSLVFLLMVALARRWRHDLRRLGFMLGWLGFALAMLGAVLLMYVASSLLRWRLLPPAPCVDEWILALLFYPALAVLFGHAHRHAAAPEQA